MNAKNNEWIYNGNTIEVIQNELTALVPIQKNVHRDENKEKRNIVLKRMIDILGGIVGLIILIPLTIIIGVFNFILGDKGRIFYTQSRIGKNGKIFKMYKFRSMVEGAEEKLKEYLQENEEARDEYAKYKKLKDDPRVTKIGKILRKTSLDEFPQFINVLKGDMSLVGPRPYLPKEIEDMGWHYQYIIKDRPGITGLWQINGRSNVTFDERLDLDLEYYNSHSLKLDIKILIQTMLKIIRKEGAV